MIPHGWKSQTRKLPAHERADYLARIVEAVEQALDENDMQRVRLFSNELNLSPQPAQLAILLYDRRDQIVSYERLIAALKCGSDCEPMSVMRTAVRHIRSAIEPFGGSIKAFYQSGYKMTCPDIPRLEWKSQVRKIPQHGRADYLASTTEDKEEALAEYNMQRLGMFRDELNLYTGRAQMAMLLYDRRGQIVTRERLIAALGCKPESDGIAVLRNSLWHVRKAIKPYGGKIKSFHLTGYKMTCPDIPQLERTTP